MFSSHSHLKHTAVSLAMRGDAIHCGWRRMRERGIESLKVDSAVVEGREEAWALQAAAARREAGRKEDEEYIHKCAITCALPCC